MDFERLLQYMYYGEVKVPNCEMEAFIRAANQMNIRWATFDAVHQLYRVESSVQETHQFLIQFTIPEV